MSSTRCLANSKLSSTVDLCCLLLFLSTLGWAVTRHVLFTTFFPPRLYMFIVFSAHPLTFLANAYLLLYIYICFGLLTLDG